MTPTSNEIFEYLTNDLGYDNNLAAGIVGNIQQESNFDPTATNEIGAFGLFQYLGPRKATLFNWAEQNGRDVNDWQTQLDYMQYEVTNDPYEKRQFEKVIREAKDPQSAAIAFSKHFERPGAREAHNNKRAKYALNAFQGKPAGGISSNRQIASLSNIAPQRPARSGASGVNIGGVPIPANAIQSRRRQPAPRQVASLAPPSPNQQPIRQEFRNPVVNQPIQRANSLSLAPAGNDADLPPLQVATSSANNPLFSSRGASRLTRGNATDNINGILLDEYQQANDQYRLLTGQDLPPINDAVAKRGTSREQNTRGSQHFHGNAIDFGTRGLSNFQKSALVDATRQAGFNGIGLGANIVHADTGNQRAWNYRNPSFAGRPVGQGIQAVRNGQQLLPDRVAALGAPIPQRRPTGLQQVQQAPTIAGARRSTGATPIPTIRPRPAIGSASTGRIATPTPRAARPAIGQVATGRIATPTQRPRPAIGSASTGRIATPVRRPVGAPAAVPVPVPNPNRPVAPQPIVPNTLGPGLTAQQRRNDLRL